MKNKLLIFVLFSFLITCCLPVFASDYSDVIVSLQIDNPVMTVNGLESEIDPGRGTKPMIIDGRTLVPIRAIIESFGGSVEWDENTKTVILTLEDDIIRLIINSNLAYLNSTAETLDASPAVINGRTMLPIRFIAEGFNIAVAWNGETKTVSLIKNSFDEVEYNNLMSVLPEYSGKAYTYINDNIPYFKTYEIINASFEYYSELDELGRCDVCFASIASDLMPTEKRESISSVKPSGWINASYDNVDGGYLYNRCHLIGFQLTGENANEKNLITGTKYTKRYSLSTILYRISLQQHTIGNKIVSRKNRS